MKSRNKYYNPNPSGKETSDCVVRALCKATGKDWDEVYRGLFEIGFELKVMPSADPAWKTYLDRVEGFKYCKIPVKKGSRRPTVDSFAAKNRKGTFILRVANHVVTVVDGYHYDLDDFGDSAVYGYYEKEEN
jgi:hypothetical protein